MSDNTKPNAIRVVHQKWCATQHTNNDTSCTCGVGEGVTPQPQVEDGSALESRPYTGERLTFTGKLGKAYRIPEVTPPSPEPPTDYVAAIETITDEGWSLAKKFHEIYERLAPVFGYKTREESAKPWAEVPHKNAQLMAATCSEILRVSKGQASPEPPTPLERAARLDKLDAPLPEGFEEMDAVSQGQAQTPKPDELLDRQYISGLREGFRLGVQNDSVRLEETINVRTRDIRESRAQVEGHAQTPKPRNWRDLYDKLPPERRAEIEAEVMKDLAELKLIDRCAYESAAWRCVKEQGHEGGHSPFLEDGECQTAQVEGQAEPPSQSTGEQLYLALARAVIGRILQADANCDPPHDILLRLEAIIRERDSLRVSPTADQALLFALKELYALVKGECPSLLNEDSGGDARLDAEITEVIAKAEALKQGGAQQ